jgi:hypothetical protein
MKTMIFAAAAALSLGVGAAYADPPRYGTLAFPPTTSGSNDTSISAKGTPPTPSRDSPPIISGSDDTTRHIAKGTPPALSTDPKPISGAGALPR